MKSYVQVSLVDVVDDEQVSRQQTFEHEDRPTLQRLRQHGVVGVGTSTTGDVPRLDTHTYTDTHTVTERSGQGSYSMDPEVSQFI